jgi:hypothetical protein
MDPQHKEFNKVYLIDFGITGSHLDPAGQHIIDENSKGFAGNLIFSSVNQFRNKSNYL